MVIARTNEPKWQQAEGGSELLQPQFTSTLGHYCEGPGVIRFYKETLYA